MRAILKTAVIASVALFSLSRPLQATQPPSAPPPASAEASSLSPHPEFSQPLTLSRLMEMAGKKRASSGKAGNHPASTRVADLKTAWFDYACFSEGLALLDEERVLLQSVAESGESRFRVGQGSQDHVLLAQVELLKLEGRRMELQGRMEAARRTINLLLFEPVEKILGKPQEETEAEVAGLPYSLDSLLKLARERSPAPAGQFHGAPHVSPSSVPVSLINLYGEATTALRLIRLHDTSLIPLAAAAMESAFEAYQAGKTELYNLTEAVKTLFEARMKRLEAFTDYRKALARMEQAVSKQ